MYLRSQQQPTSEMEDLQKLSLQNNSCFPKFETAEFILTLTQLGINTKGKPDIVSNKRKLIRWIQKAYKDITGDVDKEPEKRKTTLQDSLLFVEKFEGTNTTVGMISILGSSKKITLGSTNKGSRHHRI